MNNNWYEEFIDISIRPLVKLLRDNGWNTTSSCEHEFKGIVIIYPAGEQLGYCYKKGIDIEILLNRLLIDNNYKHFEITRKIFCWHGKTVDDYITLKMLNEDYNHRWN